MKKIILLLTIGVALTTQTLLAQVPSYVPSNGLVGYWPFSGNANDESGNGNNGVVNGATLTTDRFGNANSAYNFDGVNDFIQLQTPSLNNAITISFWAFDEGGYPNTYSINPRYVSAEFCNGGFALFNNVNSLPNGLFFTRNRGLSSADIFSTVLSTYQVNQHIVMSYDGSVAKFYINGNLVSSINNSGNIATSANLFFGKSGCNNAGQMIDAFKGKLDDIGMWNRALTQQEITNMYNGVTYSDTCNAVSGSLVNGLVSYYPFCGNANDDSGNGNNGVVNGATLTTDRFGNTNSAYFFDGLNDEIRANVNITQNITVSCWVKSLFTANDFPTFFNFYSSLSNYPWVFYGQASYNTNIGSRYVTLNSSSSPIFSDNVSNVLSLNNWQFVTIVVDSAMNKHKLYVNGILITENTFQGLHQFADKIIFGSQGQSAGQLTNFYGSLDDIGIWNRALTQTEITQLYNQNQCITNITVTDTLIINVGQLSYTNPVAYANNITIYPNPASTQININFNNITNLVGGSVKVINALGQQVATTPITTTGTNSTMLLSTWGGNGLYFVQILNPQGQIVDIKKILLQ